MEPVDFEKLKAQIMQDPFSFICDETKGHLFKLFEEQFPDPLCRAMLNLGRIIGRSEIMRDEIIPVLVKEQKSLEEVLKIYGSYSDGKTKQT